jgi:hypothetical protein
MATHRSCAQSRAGVAVHASSGEYLAYEVDFLGAQAHFVIGDQLGNIILDQGAPGPPYRARWPTTPPTTPQNLHVLNMAFIAATQYQFKLGRFDAAGKLVEVIKDCTYTGSGPDWYLEPVHIVVS